MIGRISIIVLLIIDVKKYKKIILEVLIITESSWRLQTFVIICKKGDMIS